MEHQIPSFSTLFSFLLFIFLVLRILKKSKTKHLTKNSIPGPWKLPIIGNIYQLLGSSPTQLHQRLRDLAKIYGPVMQLQLGEIHNIIITSPKTAKDVMKTQDINFAQRPFLLAGKIVFYNCTGIVTAPYGDYWRQIRKITVLELLSAKRVQSFRSIREEEVSKLVRCISSKSGSLINLSKMLVSLEYSITSRAAFGQIRKEQEALKPLMKAVVEAAGGFSIADLFPSIKFLHRISGMISKLEKLHREADEILENIIKEHREIILSAKICNNDKGGADYLVDVLLSLQEDSNFESPLTTDNIKAVILEQFVAGTETSSNLLDWAMSELAKNPRAMEKAQAEVREVFSRKGKADETGLGELNYLKLVIKETLRLHPPTPMLLPRECIQECEIDGYQIPFKSRVIINAWAIGRDPNYWAEAEKFIPERFIDSTIDYKGANFEYIPFGSGRRMCPGMSFGLANAEFPLAKLLYHFDWKLPAGMSPENLDMEEEFAAALKRKKPLNLIPIRCHPELQ